MPQKYKHKATRNKKDNPTLEVRIQYKDIEKTLKMNQTEIKTELKNPVNQLENSKESLTSGMNQTENRTSGFKDKGETKPNKQIIWKKTGKENMGNVAYHENNKIYKLRA